MEDSQKQKLARVGNARPGILAAIIVAAAFLIASVKWSQGSGRSINIIVVVLLLFLVMEGILGFLNKNRGGLNKLAEATQQLQNAAELINETAKNPNADMYAEVEYLFGVPEMRDAYHDYRMENDRLYRDSDSYRYCDIADYISGKMLDSMANAGFNDLISGMMTGLGILGTFVGLIIGLADFKNGTTDEMQETITNLIEGMRVAFLTSIFGMISSLVYNWYYKYKVQKAELALEDFYHAYYTHVVPRPDNEAITRVVRLQQDQRDSMEQFAEKISVAMANQFSETIMPALTSITEQFGTMAEKMAQKQDQSMDVIASDFVEKMDASMGGQLTRLGESVKQICEWQEGAVTAMRDVADKIAASGSNLAEVNEGMQKSVAAFSDYLVRLDELQSTLSGYFDKTIVGFEGLADRAKAQSDAMDAIVAGQQSYVENVQDLDDILSERVELAQQALDTQAEKLDEILTQQVAALRDDIQKIDELQKAVSAGMGDVSRQMQSASGAMTASTGELANNIDTTLERTFSQFDKNLAEITQHLSGTLLQMQQTTDKVPKLFMDLVTNSQAEQKKQLNQMNEALKTISDTLGKMQTGINAIRAMETNNRR